jgi:hypothetical protein
VFARCIVGVPEEPCGFVNKPFNGSIIMLLQVGRDTGEGFIECYVELLGDMASSEIVNKGYVASMKGGMTNIYPLPAVALSLLGRT